MFLAWGRQIAYEKNEISKKNEIEIENSAKC